MNFMTTSTSDEQPARTGKPLLMRLGVGLFAVGLLAVIVVFILFAAGMENLPVWLSVAAGVITPLGLGVGLVALVREHKGQ